MYGYSPTLADEVTSDITRNETAKALYLHGPCSATTIAAALELRGKDPKTAAPMLEALVSAGHAYVRRVGEITLFVLRGAGVG